MCNNDIYNDKEKMLFYLKKISANQNKGILHPPVPLSCYQTSEVTVWIYCHKVAAAATL